MADRISSSVWMALAAVFLAGLVSPAFGAETMYPDDANRAVKESVEDAYGLYILNPSRRNSKEKVEINDDTVEMWLYMDPRKPDQDKLKCEAFKWLLLGRFGKTSGAQPFFQRFPKYKNVDLVIFRLNSERTVDKDGRYVVSKPQSAYLKLRLTRAKAEKLDWAAVHTLLDHASDPKAPEPGVCMKTAEKWVDAKWYSKEYFK